MAAPRNTSTDLLSSGSFDHAFEYHYENGVFWAESNDFPGLTAAADTATRLTERIQAVLDDVAPGARWYWFCSDGSWPGGTDGLLPQK